MKENNKEELKAMPNATEAEQALLGCALSGGEREIEICLAWIRDNNAFYDDKNKNIWKAIQELYRNNVEVDLITLSDKMKDMTGDAQAFYITGLTEQVPTVANITEYARIVWEKYIQRETAKSARKLMDASYEDYKEVGNILEKHTRLISELREIQPSKQKNISDLVDQMKHNIKDGKEIRCYGKS